MGEEKAVNIEKYIKHTKLSYDRMLEIYAERMINAPYFEGRTLKQVKNFVDEKIKKETEWYIDPEECLKLGLCDSIV